MSAINRTKEQKGRCSLIEAFYRSQHLNIATSSGDEIDDDARASVARGDGWCHSTGRSGPINRDWIQKNQPMRVLLDGFWKI